MTTPPSLDALLARARDRFRARDDACATLYRQVLDQVPDHPEALEVLARFARHAGRIKEAVDLRDRLTRARPEDAGAWVALGRARLQAGTDTTDAAAAFRRALMLSPGQPDAPRSLGFLARQRNQPVEAVRWFGRWHHLAPQDAESVKALTADLLTLGRLAEALAVLRRGLLRHSKDHELWINLGIAERRSGRLTEAAQAFRRAVRLKDTDTGALYNLGQTLRELGRKDDAAKVFERLLTLDPSHANARLNLGATLKERGEWQRAATILEPLAPPPGLGQVSVFLTMARLPMLYRSVAEMETTRAAYAHDLARLATPLPNNAPSQTIRAAAGAVGGSQPYYLPYQNRDDRPLQELYGRAVHAAMSAAYPAWSTPPDVAPPAPGEPVRVGLVSGFFRWHTIWKLFLRGWMTGLDPARIQLTAYSTHANVDDTTREARAGFRRFVDYQPFEAQAETIRADHNHVVIWPEIGMDSMAARLACLRLAPVQCVSWGHPDTTGLPSMDWFLTSDFMEPEGGESFYSERLHRLPHLGIAYPPLPEPHEETDFAALGIPAEATLFLCCQFLSKYLPQYDGVLARIASRVPGARFAFIDIRRPALKAILRERLAAAFAAEGLMADDHITFLPYLSPGSYAALNDRADVYLDTIGWSGGNTTLEAVAHGLPVVTWPGPFMRGRHSAAILRQIGVTETIATDEDAYVAIAARLGTDPAWRAEIGARVKAGCPRIYEDTAPLRALEDFLDAVARGEMPTR